MAGFVFFSIDKMKNIITDSKKIDEILERGTIVEILPSKKEFREKLLSGEKLKFYIGFDPTAPTLHLSHAKNFILMEKFRKLGHKVIILFGDFTARIGDPSGEKTARKQLSREEVLRNVKRWKKLVEPLMNFSDRKNPPRIMFNNNWLAKLTLENLINLASNFTVQQMIGRDMFQKRLKEKRPIHLHEFLYPLMQGYDSVVMNVDVEVCGTDQIFNALAGRTLLKKIKGKEKFVVAVTLMENPKTGELMSKSKGTGIFLDASASNLYGQVMSQPDEMTEILFTNNTYLSLEEIKKLIKKSNPRDSKMRLAFEIVSIYHGEKEAKTAQTNFVKTFQKRELPDKIKSLVIKEKAIKLSEFMLKSGVAESRSDARRKIEQGGVSVDGKKTRDYNYVLGKAENGKVIKVGKLHFARIVFG